MSSFDINPQQHRQSTRAAKVRNLAKGGATEGERAAAQGKTKGPSIPLVRKGDTSIRNVNAGYEPSLVNKILDENGCGCDEPKCNNTPSGKKCPMHGMKDCSVKEEKDPKGPVKKYKSPKEIADKHGVSLESIKKQLEMGIKVEGEHTSDKTAAKITALQHLDEVPDYYTKLKKVEKKTTSESVTIEDMFGNKFVEFIDLIRPEDVLDEKKQKGLWDNIHARREAGLPRKKPGEKGYPKTLKVEDHIPIAMGKMLDDEGGMIRNQLETIERSVELLRAQIKSSDMQIPAWVQAKVTLATENILTCANYMAGKDEGVKEAVNAAQQAAIAINMKKEGKKPKKVDEEKIPVTRQAGDFRYSGKTGEEKAERRAKVLSNSPDPKKRRQANTIRSKIKTVADRDTARASSDARQKLYRGQQRRANDLAKQLMNKEETQVTEAVRMQAEFGNLVAVVVMWRATTQQITMFFPQAKMPSRKEVEHEAQKVYPNCKVISFIRTDLPSNQLPVVRVGAQGGNYGKIGPNKNYVKPMGEEVEFDEDWQKSNRNDGVDGLSQSTVDAYKREHPGSKLQTAVTEKKPKGKRAKRRSNFCRRMKGMKKRLTSAKTARDPNSRINKALRRWRCH